MLDNLMRSNPLRWLLLAGAIHITLTVAVFLIGHFQLLPNVFDPHGIGLSFAIDGKSYREYASRLATELQTFAHIAPGNRTSPARCNSRARATS